MPYNYKKLLGKIVEVVGSQSNFAKAMELSERTISLKMNGKISWKQSEMIKASEILGFAISEVPEYFFAFDVQY